MPAIQRLLFMPTARQTNWLVVIAFLALGEALYGPLFRPTARQTNWLLVMAFLALGEALYLRYHVMENATVSLACQGGLDTWLCGTFRLTTVLYPYQVFGGVALVVALLNLLRPSIVLVAVSLAAAAFGVVCTMPICRHWQPGCLF